MSKPKESLTNGEARAESVVAAEQPMDLLAIPQTGIKIEEEIERLEKNIELFNRIKIVSLKLTKASDWVDQGGSPYLMDRGAENIAIAWGVDITDVTLGPPEWAEDEHGRYYTFIARGKAYSKKLGRYVEDIGVCSQRDRFFGMVGGKLKPIEDVDMANIRRKAVTNLYTRLIRRVVGLTGVTFEDLKLAGIDVSKIQKIEYRGGSEKTRRAATPKDREKQQELWDMLLQYTGGEEENAREILKEKSAFTAKSGEPVEGVTDVKYLTGRWLQFTFKKVKEFVSMEREPGEEG